MKNTRMAKRLQRSRIGIKWLLDAMALRYLLHTGEVAPLSYFLYPPANRPKSLDKMSGQAYLKWSLTRQTDNLYLLNVVVPDPERKQRVTDLVKHLTEMAGIKRGYMDTIPSWGPGQ